MEPKEIVCVAPSRVQAGEPFSLKVRLLGEVRDVPSLGGHATHKPGLKGPYNLNVSRQIQFVDNVLEEWSGELTVSADGAYDGPERLVFDGQDQGVYRDDHRPVKKFEGFCLREPGFHFLRVSDPASGVTGYANPVYVSVEPPRERIYWGDPHWQTYFSDGIRCPEELYTFARDEGFLDFGAISDHMEGVTDRQWEYFQAVTNDFNEPGRFVTLQGQEWTHHNRKGGAPGHRNIYYRGDHGPVLRSNDPDCDTLEKLWAKLDALPSGNEAIAIPHHSANVVMGVKWELGWNPTYEKTVEIYSVWGSSEKPAAQGNPLPIINCKGEMEGRHVVDALKRGYRMAFVGGGDVHDGRPGQALHGQSYKKRASKAKDYSEGLTAALVPSLTREHVFDAMRDGRTYAATNSRIYLDCDYRDGGFVVQAASEDGIRDVTVVRNGEDDTVLTSDGDDRVVTSEGTAVALAPGDFAYIRVTTAKENMAWSSPDFG